MQGRFWQEQFDGLNVPSQAKEKFMFTDGNPRVLTPFSLMSVPTCC